jgi:DNA-binding NtrC family response regulator
MNPAPQMIPPACGMTIWRQPHRTSELAICPKDIRWAPGALGALVGQSPAMQEIFSTIRQLAPSMASVLISGPSGTGKELVAREIHNCSDRRNGPFVAINAAALPEGLIESELFGHEKGAFTGATECHPGCFEQAHGGTLFLDEIGEMPRSTQPRLLRVLEDLRVRRLGGRSEIPVNVRVLAATSQPVETHLREDLYYRLSVFQIPLPPLSTRIEDIPLIAHAMIPAVNKKNGTRVTGIDRDVLKILQDNRWPGNVRQLRNVIERASIVAGSGTIHVDHLQSVSPPSAARAAVRCKNPEQATLLPGRPLAEIEEVYIKMTLEHVKNNRTRAAAMLDISLRTLRNRLASFLKETQSAAADA